VRHERPRAYQSECGKRNFAPAASGTSGAGDVFHGTYVYSYPADATKSWEEHFCFGRAASAYKIQHLGNEAGLPTLADITPTEREFTGNIACPGSAAAMSEMDRKPTLQRATPRPLLPR
jgi:hypothetical protein